MKLRSEGHGLLIAAAVALIAASLALYGLLLYRWLGRGPVGVPFAPRAAPPEPEDLQLARARFRERFLDPASRLRLAQALRSRGRLVDAFYVTREARLFFGDDAFRAAHETVSLGGADDGAARAQARAAARRGDRDEAFRLIQQGLSEKPSDPSLLLLKADLTAQADVMGAIPLYARLANAAPRSSAGRRALEALQKLASKKESDAQAEAGQLAQEALQELFKAQPKEPGVFRAMALAALGRGDAAAARAMVVTALRDDPAQAGAIAIDGLLALSDGSTERALRDFTKAQQLDPTDLQSAEQLARLYDREQGDREAALPHYLALYLENPDASVGGAQVEDLIQGILDQRRKALLERVPAEDLGRFFDSDDASLRAQACAREGELRDPRWLDRLAELLDDDCDIVRHNADFALYRLAAKVPSELGARRDLWLQSPQPLTRARALNLFSDLSARQTYPAVSAALRDPSPVVRYLAKTMILDRYYRDWPQARRDAAQALAGEKDPEVLALYKRKP